jgi:hypothetical protein
MCLHDQPKTGSTSKRLFCLELQPDQTQPMVRSLKNQSPTMHFIGAILNYAPK